MANAVASVKIIASGDFRFPNFTRVDFIARILEKETSDIQCAQVSYVSLLLGIRVPSEALILRRAVKNDDLTGYDPMREEDWISLRGELRAECLVIRFERRKNLPNSCVRPRRCFCNLSICQARKRLPAHAMWPAIAARAKCGEPLFTEFPSQNINRSIKSVFEKLDIPFATSYTSRGYRRGDTQELKERGNQWPIIAPAGESGRFAFMGYLAVAKDVADEMSKLLIVAEKLSDEEVGHWVTGPRR